MIGVLIYQIINILQLLLVIRAICSWFPEVQRSQIGQFLVSITEPMIAPVRKYLMRFDFIRNFPIDISFIVVLILLNFVGTLAIALF